MTSEDELAAEFAEWLVSLRRLIAAAELARTQAAGLRAGQAFAAMDGRFSVAVDDIKKAAIPVLRHRIAANFQAQAEGKTSDDIVTELLKAIGEPEPTKYVSGPAGGVSSWQLSLRVKPQTSVATPGRPR